MVVDLHQPQLDLVEFTTREERMSKDHKSKTPEFTVVAPLTPLHAKAVEKQPSRLAVIPPFKLAIPETVEKFSTSAHQIRCFTPMGLVSLLPRCLEMSCRQ
jgi:hypothetical protein